MKNVTKVAISIPVDVLRSLEHVRARLHKTRSAAVTEALRSWLQTEEMSEDEQRYVQGYLRHPEQTTDTAAIASAAVENWEPWE